MVQPRFPLSLLRTHESCASVGVVTQLLPMTAVTAPRVPCGTARELPGAYAGAAVHPVLRAERQTSTGDHALARSDLAACAARGARAGDLPLDCRECGYRLGAPG